MSKHTPGPWEFRRDGFVYSLATGERVCSPHSTLHDSHKVKEHIKDLRRNARLIAAAPTMYEALKQIAGTSLGASFEMQSIARAAISAAEGEKT